MSFKDYLYETINEAKDKIKWVDQSDDNDPVYWVGLVPKNDFDGYEIKPQRTAEKQLYLNIINNRKVVSTKVKDVADGKKKAEAHFSKTLKENVMVEAKLSPVNFKKDVKKFLSSKINDMLTELPETKDSKERADQAQFVAQQVYEAVKGGIDDIDGLPLWKSFQQKVK